MLKKYESNNHLLEELAEKLISANSLLEKAKTESGSSRLFGDYIREAISLNQDANILASEIYQSFIILKEDYRLGTISGDKFRNHLFDLKLWFELPIIQPLQLPILMCHWDIKIEIEKHFS